MSGRSEWPAFVWGSPPGKGRYPMRQLRPGYSRRSKPICGQRETPTEKFVLAPINVESGKVRWRSAVFARLDSPPTASDLRPFLGKYSRMRGQSSRQAGPVVESSTTGTAGTLTIG